MLVRTRKEKNMSHRGEPARKRDPKSLRRKRSNPPVPVLGIAMILLLVVIAFVLFYYR